MPAISEAVRGRQHALGLERFEALYVAHRSSIIRYLRRRLGDDDGEDAAAEVFLRAYRRIDALESTPGESRPWLYGIAEYVVLERWRAEERRLRLIERVAGQVRSEQAARLAVESDRPIAHVEADRGIGSEPFRCWVRQARADANHSHCHDRSRCRPVVLVNSSDDEST